MLPVSNERVGKILEDDKNAYRRGAKLLLAFVFTFVTALLLAVGILVQTVVAQRAVDALAVKTAEVEKLQQKALEHSDVILTCQKKLTQCRLVSSKPVPR